MDLEKRRRSSAAFTRRAIQKFPGRLGCQGSLTFAASLKRKRVPLADPAGDLEPLRHEILKTIERVVDCGHYILGPAVTAFEQRLAARLGVPETVGVASGTDALALALLALDVQPGDEVVTVSHTAGPTVAAIRMIGAVPVLIDVEPDTLCLDPAYLEDAYGSLCKAVIAVHLYGHPANMGPIIDFGRRHALAIVEDCAQAQEAVYNGHIVGTLGDSGCFSFYPTKNLGALGDGGLVSARDPQVIKRLRLLRTYGWSQPQFADLPFGRCSRLDEVQAAILSVKLSHLDAHVERRRAIAGRYSEAFADLPLTLPSERPGCRHVYHLYVVRTGRRDALAKHLEAAGIATGRHYPFPIHRQPGLAGTARVPRPLAVTEKSSEEVLSLPMFPSLSDEQQDQVIKAVRRFFARV